MGKPKSKNKIKQQHRLPPPSEKPFSKIPFDSLLHAFTHLECLQACKQVCKEWNMMLKSGDYFNQMWLKKHTGKNMVIFRVMEYGGGHKGRASAINFKSWCPSPGNSSPPWFFSNHSRAACPLVSSNGLVLYKTEPRQLVVANPVTGSSKKLPLLNNCDAALGYKLMVSHDHSFVVGLFCERFMVFCEYNSESWGANLGWKSTPCVELEVPTREELNSWMVFRLLGKCDCCIELGSDEEAHMELATFDLRNYAWKQFRLPQVQLLKMEVFLYDGRLMMAGIRQASRISEDDMAEVLELREDGLKWEFVTEYKLDTSGRCKARLDKKRPTSVKEMLISAGGDLVVFGGESQYVPVMAYNLKDGFWSLLEEPAGMERFPASEDSEFREPAIPLPIYTPTLMAV